MGAPDPFAEHPTDRTGTTITLALEPKTLLPLETIAATIDSSKRNLFSKEAIGRFADAKATAQGEAESTARRHVACFDRMSMAVAIRRSRARDRGAWPAARNRHRQDPDQRRPRSECFYRTRRARAVARFATIVAVITAQVVEQGAHEPGSETAPLFSISPKALDGVGPAGMRAPARVHYPRSESISSKPASFFRAPAVLRDVLPAFERTR